MYFRLSFLSADSRKYVCIRRLVSIQQRGHSLSPSQMSLPRERLLNGAIIWVLTCCAVNPKEQLSLSDNSTPLPLYKFWVKTTFSWKSIFSTLHEVIPKITVLLKAYTLLRYFAWFNWLKSGDGHKLQEEMQEWCYLLEFDFGDNNVKFCLTKPEKWPVRWWTQLPAVLNRSMDCVLSTTDVCVGG